MRLARAIVMGAAVVVALSATAADGATRPRPAQNPKTQVVDVSTPTRAAKERLQRLGLDLTEHGDADSLEVVLYGDADVQRLREAGFTYTVRIGDLAARDASNRESDARYAASTALSPLPSGRDSYRHLADYERELVQLASDHPDLARAITLDHRSWEGRPITGIEITRDPAAEDGKPVLLMLGAHHAREWPSAEHSIEFAYDLLRGYGNDARTTALVDATRTIVVPVVNPDGFVVSREARMGPASQDFSTHDFEMKRKNCRDVVGSCDRRTRTSGVDLNRNYGGLWGGPGASPTLSSDVYRGPAPFSEPEVQAIRDLIGSRQVTMVVTNHTYANLILRSPGTIDQGFPHEEPQAASLGDRMASRNGYDSVPGFELYDTTGTTEDWSFWTAGALTYTFEIGPEEFHPPYETGVVAEYLGLAPAAGAGRGGNRAAYFDALEATASSALHAVLTGVAPTGSRLSLTKSISTATSPVCVDDFCNRAGDVQTFEEQLHSEMVTDARTFTWHINPSTRPIVAGRQGREPLAPPQPAIVMFNDPAVVPDENIHYPWSPTPSRVEPPYEVFEFEVQAPPAADNEQVAVHIEWSDPETDWDLYLLDPSGELVAASALWGDNDEDVRLYQPSPGVYTAVVVNYQQADRRFDDWSGTVTFTAPSPATTGPKESWLFRCETPEGVIVAQDVVVDRGETFDLGHACRRSE